MHFERGPSLAPACDARAFGEQLGADCFRNTQSWSRRLLKLRRSEALPVDSVTLKKAVLPSLARLRRACRSRQACHRSEVTESRSDRDFILRSSDVCRSSEDARRVLGLNYERSCRADAEPSILSSSPLLEKHVIR